MKSDNPSLYDDNLNYSKYARALSKVIINGETPFTIGISGEWGYGKTTLMKYISYYLDKKSFNKVIENIKKEKSEFFNEDLEKDINLFYGDEKIENNDYNIIFLDTWPFINSKDIGESIFEQVMYELIEIIKNNESKFEEVGKFLLKSIGAFVKTVKFKGEIGGIGVDFDPSKFKMDDMFITDISSSNFQISVKEILNEITKKLGGKLVIFIDDLDRLYPKQALEVILFMKNFLTVKGCIFIIGSDNEVVKEGLEVLYGKYGEKDDNVSRKEYIDKIKKDFFEKIYQLEFKMPNLLLEEINTYFENFVITVKKSNEKKKIFILDDDFKEVKTFIQQNINNFNPRKIKKIFNTYDLFISITGNVGSNNSKINRVILELSIIYVLDFDLFNKIKGNINFIEKKEKISGYTKTLLYTFTQENPIVINAILNSFGGSEEGLFEISKLLKKLKEGEYLKFLHDKEKLLKIIPFLQNDIENYKVEINNLIETYFDFTSSFNKSIEEVLKQISKEYSGGNTEIYEKIRILGNK